MRKINFIFQEVLKFLLIFLLMFVWIRYFLRSLWLAILVSALVSAVVYAILYFIFRKKKNKEGLKIKEKEDAENMFLSLACNEKRMNFFAELALKKHKDVRRFSKYILITHENKTKTLLYPKMDFESLTIQKFLEIYNAVKGKAEKVVILCHSFDKDVKAFANNFDIYFLILDRFDTYQNLYKFYNFFPEVKERYKKDKMLSFKDFVAYSFNKKRAKGYLLSAFLLVLSALFVRTTIYYCISATILIIFAIISRYNNIFNFKDNGEVL